MRRMSEGGETGDAEGDAAGDAASFAADVRAASSSSSPTTASNKEARGDSSSNSSLSPEVARAVPGDASTIRFGIPNLWRLRDHLASSVGDSGKRSRVRGITRSLTASGRDGKGAIGEDLLRFGTVECAEVSFRDLPFVFSWANNGGGARIGGQRKGEDLNQKSLVAPVQVDRWFHQPPKVRIVPSIMGAIPSSDPRVNISGGGEREVRGDLESGHHSPISLPHPPVTSAGDSPSKIPKSPNQTLNRCGLARFVGHFWKGGRSKSYAAALRSETAKVVPVMNRGGGDRRDYGREEPGAGRYGRGGGRPNARPNVWARVEKPPESSKAPMEDHQADEGKNKMDMQEENWDKYAKPNPQDREAQNNGGFSDAVEGKAQGNDTTTNNSSGVSLNRGFQGGAARVPCEVCGLNNHLTRDCRRQFCEFCGFGNHNTYLCTRCVPWNMGPKLCAAQVEDQSFFFIPKIVDPKVAKEKDSTAIISIVDGEANGRQIEMELASANGSDTWKWKARQIGEKKYMVRFPTAKLLNQWCHFKYLPMDCAEARMRVETWNSSLGAIGRLQDAWFRVHGIPGDQRSIRTIAQIGGLVGKTMELDPSTRFSNEFVRIRLACMDVSKVPSTAKCTLGMNVHIFTFEREVDAEEGEKLLKSGIKVSEGKQPTPKKFKSAESSANRENIQGNDRSSSKFSRMGSGYNNSQSQSDQVLPSDPPKMGWARRAGSKVMKDAQESLKDGKNNEDAERTCIPNNCEDSDAESETMSDKLKKIGVYVGDEQDCSKDGNQQAWLFNDGDISGGHNIPSPKQGADKKVSSTPQLSDLEKVIPIYDSPEVYTTEDNIVTTQESIPDEGKDHNLTVEDLGGDGSNVDKDKITELCKEVGKNKTKTDGQPMEKRRSDRLKMEITKTTPEKNDAMARKRNLEGLYSEEDKEMLERGVDMMIQIATGMLAQKKSRGFGGAPDDDKKKDGGPCKRST